MIKYIVVTGGAGFIGSNLIEKLIRTTNYKILSIDNYSTGVKKNHVDDDKRIKYIKSDTKKISKILDRYKKYIKAIFHFGEFSRIYQSFLKMDECIESNTVGTNEVFRFCLKNKIKLIYSATSASLGNNGNDKNLSPYAFTKAKNLEMLNNLKKWFNFKYEVIFFYNVYGPNQIQKGRMATVIGIFEEQYKNKKPLTIVRPGSQSRRFTHVSDTIDACLFAFKKNKCRYYSISNKKSYTIRQVANFFDCKKKYLRARPGERYASALTNMNLTNKVFKLYGKIQLKDYLKDIINKGNKNNF
jgi:UDP-glucose 4-epimerase